MPKPPKQSCIDSFEYKAYLGINDWNEPEYAAAITINNCRIDRGAEFTSDRSGKQLLYNAVIFCYEGITTPIPKFKTESIVIYDDVEHVITKVIPNYEAYQKSLFSYELEVV